MLLFLLACPVGGDTGEVPDGREPRGRDSATGDDTDDSETIDETGGDPGPDDCDVRIESTVPSQNSVDAYYRAPIEFELTEADDDAWIESDVSGTTTRSEDGQTLYFTPASPLEPETSYTVTLNYCRGEVSLDFTTSELGTPLADEGALVGRTWAAQLSDARIVEPRNVGDLLKQYMGDIVPLVAVTAVGGGELGVRIGSSLAEVSPPEQAFCDPTVEPPAADFSAAPHFQTSGEMEVSVNVAGVSVPVTGSSFAGDFAPDGSYIGGLRGEGSVDTRALDSLVSEDAEEGYICDLAAGLGITCEDCPDGSGEFCLPLVIDHGTAVEVEGLSLAAVEGNDCLGCMEGLPDDVSETCEPDPDAPSSSGCIVVATSASLAWAGILAVGARRRRG